MTDEREARVVLSEDIESELDDALTSAMRIRDERRERLGMPASRSDLAENLRGDLRAALSEGVVVAVQPTKDGINERELEREIIKKALITMDTKALRRVALRRQVPIGGAKEDIATRVATAYKWSSEEIANVVHSYELEASTNNGPSMRLFSVRDSLDFDVISRRLGYVSGRYVRVGLAKWFSFVLIEQRAKAQEISISGTLHSYSASVSAENIQRMDSPTSHEIVIQQNGRVSVSGANASQAKACMEAVRDVTGIETRDYVPYAELNAEAPLNHLHPATEFMLDLIYGRLNGGAFTEPNVLHARFKTQRVRPGAVPVDDTKRARLKSVRLDGDYTLDLSQACQYMILDRRPLLDVTVSARPKGADDDLTCPVRLVLETDHLYVATGPGTAGLEAAETLHEEVVRHANQGLTEGISDESLIHEFAVRIRERASESTDIDEQEPFLGTVSGA